MNTEYRDQLNLIKAEMLHGVLTYDQAKAKAQPIIDALNVKARQIAKKYGKRHYDFTFTGLMR